MIPDQQGKSIGTIVGIILAISLTSVERTIGFNLKSFGPLAAGLIIFMVALVIYNMMRYAGAGHVAGGSSALIVTYFTIRLIQPQFFLWANRNEWANYLHNILIIAVIISSWKFISSLFNFSSSNSISSLKQAVNNISDNSPEIFSTLRQNNLSDLHTVKHKMSGLAYKGKRECKKIINILKQVKEIIQQHGTDQNIAYEACKVLNTLKVNEHVLESELIKIQKIDENLIRFDLSNFKELKAKYQKLDKKKQKKIKKSFLEEREKLSIEVTIREMTIKARTYLMQFDNFITKACQCLKSGQTGDSLSWIRNAIENEEKIEELIHHIHKHEKMLSHLLIKHIVKMGAEK